MNVIQTTHDTQGAAVNSGRHGISAVIVAHNEEAVLERCLASIADVVHEIVFVHDGPCTDRTLEIATRYGARTFVRELSGSAEAHRAFSYARARCDWILQIDADEYLSSGLHDQLRRLTEADDVDAYIFRWPTTDGKKALKGYEDTTKIALLRTSKLYYLGITHQAPQSYGRTVKRLDLTLEHWPLRDDYTWERFRTKHLAKNALQAWQIYALHEAPVFNISSEQWATNPLVRYYQEQLRHPYWFSVKRYVLADIAKTFLRRNPWHVLITNGHVSLMFWLSALYVARRIRDYQGYREEQTVISQNCGSSAY